MLVLRFAKEGGPVVGAGADGDVDGATEGDFPPSGVGEEEMPACDAAAATSAEFPVVREALASS